MNVLREIQSVLNETVRMHQLNLELLEQLNITCKFVLENKVEIPNTEKIVSLLNKADALLNEIYTELPSDDFSHEPRNRRRLHRTSKHNTH